MREKDTPFYSIHRVNRVCSFILLYECKLPSEYGQLHTSEVKKYIHGCCMGPIADMTGRLKLLVFMALVDGDLCV